MQKMMSVRWSVLLTVVDLGSGSDAIEAQQRSRDVGQRAKPFPFHSNKPFRMRERLRNAAKRYGSELERAPYSLVKCDQTSVFATFIMNTEQKRVIG
jgi:hypothetical protein